MKLKREHLRAMIFYDFRRGLTEQQSVDQLSSAFGNEAPSRATVFRWFSDFKRGRSSLHDGIREGRPKSAVVPQNIDAVRELIQQDQHVTYRKIEASLGISATSINKILHDHLAVEKEENNALELVADTLKTKVKKRESTRLGRRCDYGGRGRERSLSG